METCCSKHKIEQSSDFFQEFGSWLDFVNRLDILKKSKQNVKFACFTLDSNGSSYSVVDIGVHGI